jgi:hypothetical protein
VLLHGEMEMTDGIYREAHEEQRCQTFAFNQRGALSLRAVEEP